MLVATKDQWIPLSEAARRVGVSQAKLSRMVKLGKVETKKNPRDERQTLVNLVQLNRLFSEEE